MYMYIHTDSPVAGGSKKQTLRKLRAKVDFDQENGEVTNKACMGVWGVGIGLSRESGHLNSAKT